MQTQTQKIFINHFPSISKHSDALTMMTCINILLLAAVLPSGTNPVLAFMTGGVSSFVARKPTHQTSAINRRSPLPAPATSTKLSKIFLVSPPEEDNNKVNKRRAFLASFASAPILPLLPTPSFARGTTNENGPLVYGDDSIMSPKEHGTTATEVQENLRYGVSRKLADKISSFNRVFAEMGGYFEGTSFEDDVRRIVKDTGSPVTFYDSVSGKPLFRAPIGRSVDAFMTESAVHGWPSFRDEEVLWDNVRVLKSSGETVSTVGTHLGHNLPDKNGNRYCINLVSIAGNPISP